MRLRLLMYQLGLLSVQWTRGGAGVLDGTTGGEALARHGLVVVAVVGC